MTTTSWVVVGLVCLAAAAVGYAFLQPGSWETHMAAGDKAYQQGNYPEAEKQLVAALKEAEGFGPQDPRLATTLNNLARLYEAQGKYAEAEPFYKRALVIREKALGPDHPNVAQSLNNLAGLYDKAAEQGDAEAQYNLGLMYATGRGVPQDYAQAVKWYRKAAEQGLARAQAYLGLMYYKGRGVPQDYAEAAKWYRKAAEQGNAVAQARLGYMYWGENDAEAARWYRKAAEQGHAWAQYNLGLMYATGRGVPQDYVQAHLWISLAAAQGLYDAAEGRKSVAVEMTPAQIADAERLAREWTAKQKR